MTHDTATTIAAWLVGVPLAIAVARQCRRPTWILGRLIARSMNASHVRLTAWGLSHLSIGPEATVLDIGCGGGQTIKTLASMAANGKVFGVDYAPASIATARATNAKQIATGSVDIRPASVSNLPFPADMFDVVTAVETHYYWPDLQHDLEEVRRVLKPGGRLMILAEAYRGKRLDFLFWPVMALLGARYLTRAEHARALEGAGYRDVEVLEERTHGWICALGSKPS
ncbi:MAG TPA: class I SAM-dependent methyltransferase [Gemmatimonadaceae bacterium]|nr:class I SAM-dependent methyltransferase [Gemmatimonadaceae bacterium]